MAEYKICPGCGMKNPASAWLCEKCQNDLFSVDITSELDSNDIGNTQNSGSLPENLDKLFANATEHKPVSTGGKRVIKQINVKEKPLEKGNEQLFKYCTCGEPNSSSAVRCNACGVDIKGVIPETKEDHQKRLKSIIDCADSLKSQSSLGPNVKIEREVKRFVPKFIISRDLQLKIEPISERQMIGRGLATGNKVEAYLSNKSHVSRKHLMIWKTSTGIFVRDIGSTNGSYINGKKLSANQDYQLNVGDVLVLGYPKSDESNIAVFNVE